MESKGIHNPDQCILSEFFFSQHCLDQERVCSLATTVVGTAYLPKCLSFFIDHIFFQKTSQCFFEMHFSQRTKKMTLILMDMKNMAIHFSSKSVPLASFSKCTIHLSCLAQREALLPTTAPRRRRMGRTLKNKNLSAHQTQPNKLCLRGLKMCHHTLRHTKLKRHGNIEITFVCVRTPIPKNLNNFPW